MGPAQLYAAHQRAQDFPEENLVLRPQRFLETPQGAFRVRDGLLQVPDRGLGFNPAQFIT